MTGDAKQRGREKLQLALDNFLQAELEGAEELTPATYQWAKHKIYEDKKLILKPNQDEKICEEASDDASAAAAQLLSVVRKRLEEQVTHKTRQKTEDDAIKDLVNEGGPAI